MITDRSYPAVMAQRAAIIRASIGLDYDRYTMGALAFDYERLLADTGYDIGTAQAVQARTGVGQTPLIELSNITALARTLSRPGKGARIFLKDEAKNPSGSFKDRRASLSVYEAGSVLNMLFRL
ncbi:MAG: pyridoxal-phosphate dependent enzyme [Candidatus Competibacteraceae bacterium]